MFNQLFHRHSISTKVIQATKIIFVLIPVAIFVVLANNNLLFTATLSSTYHPGKTNGLVSPTTPTTLIHTADKSLRWSITTDVLPFNVTIPRLIEAVRVRVRLNPGTASLVTLNADSKTDGDYSVIAASKVLDTLDWKRISDGTTSLWMRDKHVSQKKVTTSTGKNVKTTTETVETPVRQYATVADFLRHPPDTTAIAAIGYDRMAMAAVPDYQPSTTPITINHSLRGRQQIYIYAANEDLKLSFDKTDLNRQKGADKLTVLVARADQLTSSSRTWLKKVTVPDDGNTKASGPRGKAQHADITIPNVQPGTYLIDFNAEDVVISNITSTQHHLAFNGRLLLAEGPAFGETSFRPAQVKTNGTLINIAAQHDQGKQDVTINGQKLKLKDLKLNQTVSGLSGTTSFDVAKGDVSISSNGLLTLAPAELIPDGLGTIDLAGTPDLTPYDYILAQYQPRATGDITVEQTYQLSDLALKGKTLNFSINVPGITSGQTLGLKDIQATLIRGPFPWDKVWKKLGLKK